MFKALMKIYFITVMNALCTMKKKTIALKKNETISNHNWFDAFYEKINDEVSINLIIDQNNMLDDIINKFKELALNNETYVTKKIQLFSNPKNHSIFLYNTKEIIIDLSLKLLKKENLLFHCIDEEKKIYEPYIFDFDLINNCVYDKFKLIGRFIGLAIKNRIFIPFKLSDYFIKLLYGKNITGNDILFKGSFLSKNLKNKKKLLKKKNAIVRYDVKIIGKNLDNDLLEFTNPLKSDFVKKSSYKKYCADATEFYITKYKLVSSIVREGILDIIDVALIETLTLPQFKIFINGSGKKININTWMNHTYYLGINANESAVQWFWQHIKTYDKKALRNIFFIFTGLFDIPLGGLRASNILFNISHSSDNTCYYCKSSHTLYLPTHSSYNTFIEAFFKMLDLI